VSRGIRTCFCCVQNRKRWDGFGVKTDQRNSCPTQNTDLSQSQNVISFELQASLVRGFRIASLSSRPARFERHTYSSTPPSPQEPRKLSTKPLYTSTSRYPAIDHALNEIPKTIHHGTRPTSFLPATAVTTLSENNTPLLREHAPPALHQPNRHQRPRNGSPPPPLHPETQSVRLLFLHHNLESSGTAVDPDGRKVDGGYVDADEWDGRKRDDAEWVGDEQEEGHVCGLGGG